MLSAYYENNNFVRLVGHVGCLVTSDELLDVLEQFPHSP